MQAQTEDECAHLVRLLPPTEAALLDWAINLMTDVAQLEHLNKMNARNIAMVFAPNMTQVSSNLILFKVWGTLPNAHINFDYQVPFISYQGFST